MCTWSSFPRMRMVCARPWARRIGNIRGASIREGWRGYLFQGRFASYPMDDAHLMAAIRYVEHNPVAAAMVARPENWNWSSARSHAVGKCHADDSLTDLRLRTGRPLAAAEWIAEQERLTGMAMAKRKPGPRAKR